MSTFMGSDGTVYDFEMLVSYLLLEILEALGDIKDNTTPAETAEGAGSAET